VLRCHERPGSLGIVNMQERAESIGGELEIKSMPGQGTYITIYVVKAR
jgi:signal transduction histidine kinase